MREIKVTKGMIDQRGTNTRAKGANCKELGDERYDWRLGDRGLEYISKNYQVSDKQN